MKSDPEKVREIRERIGAGFLVGHVAALDNDQKAQDTVIEAARLLQGSRPEVHFLLIGGGKDEAKLHALAAGLDNLSFAGFVSNVGDYLAALDALILPSRREGMGSILLDAMEYSLPVVAAAVGGVPHVVSDGHNGFLIDVDSPQQLVDRLLRLESDAPMRERMGQAGREIAAVHTPAKMAAAYLDLYRAILGPGSA